MSKTTTATICRSTVVAIGVCVAGIGYCDTPQQCIGLDGAVLPVSLPIGMPWQSPVDSAGFGGMQSRGAQSARLTSENSTANSARMQMLVFPNLVVSKIEILFQTQAGVSVPTITSPYDARHYQSGTRLTIRLGSN